MSLFGLIVGLIELLVFAYAVLFVLVHVLMAVEVLNNAGWRRMQKRSLVLFPPVLWGMLTLVTGVLGAAFYWAAHYSTLNPELAHSELAHDKPGQKDQTNNGSNDADS